MLQLVVNNLASFLIDQSNVCIARRVLQSAISIYHIYVQSAKEKAIILCTALVISRPTFAFLLVAIGPHTNRF